MPLVRISMPEGIPPDRRAALSEGVVIQVFMNVGRTVDVAPAGELVVRRRGDERRA
jgi:hypothetical protein